jgi:hypothetical protein
MSPTEPQRCPVYAGKTLLGWILLRYEMKGEKRIGGRFEPGPGYEPHRALFEEAVEVATALKAFEGTTETTAEEEALCERCWGAGERITALNLRVGESREPIRSAHMYDGWVLELYSLADTFGERPRRWPIPDDGTLDLSPVPSHLEGWTTLTSVEDDWVKLAVRCPCGSERMEFHYPGQTHLVRDEPIPCTVEIGGEWFFLIKAVCRDCRKEHVLFDSHFHGHDGFLFSSRGKKATLPRPPLVPWQCLKCGSVAHTGSVSIISDYKERYFEDGYGEEFGPEHWPDAYGCFGMSIACCDCGHKTPGWVDYEAR